MPVAWGKTEMILKTIIGYRASLLAFKFNVFCAWLLANNFFFFHDARFEGWQTHRRGCMPRSICVPPQVGHYPRGCRGKKKINVFKLLSYSGIERWERFRRQKVTDSSPPPKSPFRAAHLNIIAAFHPDNESKEKGTFEMQMQDNNLLKKRLHGACVVQPACSEIPKWFTKAPVCRLQKFCLSRSFLPAREEDWGCTKVRRFWILNRGSLRCCWLCWTWQVLFLWQNSVFAYRISWICWMDWDWEISRALLQKKPLICSVSGPNQHRLRLANLPGCSNTHADGAEIECRLFVGFRLSSLLVSQPLLVPGDLTDEETVKRTVEQTLAHYGRLDVLVNSAGILAMGGIETPDLAQYDRVMNINVRWDFCPTTEQNTRLKKKKTY